MSKRRDLRNFYLKNPTILKSIAGSTDKYSFRGSQISYSVLIRIDLNGYSSWSRDKNVVDKVRLLDDFFSKVIDRIEQYGGVFYRDEGDCLLVLFSDYFQTGASVKSIIDFCMSVTRLDFGYQGNILTAKTVVNTGEVLFFQKSHESGTDDWSAEGQVFVENARFEASVESKKNIYFFKETYQKGFSLDVTRIPIGSNVKPDWIEKEGKIQIQGLGLNGGWQDIIFLECNN